MTHRLGSVCFQQSIGNGSIGDLWWENIVSVYLDVVNSGPSNGLTFTFCMSQCLPLCFADVLAI